MNGFRATATAAAAALLVISAAAPALADGPAVDDVPPVVSATGLIEGQIVARYQVMQPTWSDDLGVVKVEVLVDGVVNRTYKPPLATGRVAVTLPVSSNDTDIDITIRASDAAGNSGAATTRVHADTARPTATFAPPFRSYIGGVATITATDLPDDVAKITLWDQKTARYVAEATSAPWTLTWDTTALASGGRWVNLAVYDRVGNFQLYQDFYGVDNDLPQIIVEFPAVDGRIGGRSKLRARVIDYSLADRIEWWVDGTLRATGRQFVWDTHHENRTATLEVRAYDSVGHSTFQTSQVLLDNTGPTIASVTPGHHALVRGKTFRTTVRATDGAGVREAYLDAATDADPPYAVDAWAGQDGLQTLTWIVTDQLGNESRMSRVVVVDNTRPTLKITKAPKNGAKVSGTVMLIAAASDRNGIGRVELLINGKVVAKDLRARYAFSINTRRYGKKIQIKLRAYDKAGNSAATAIRTWRR